MKKVLILITFIINYTLQAQITFSLDNYVGKTIISEKSYKTLKKTTTVFVLSDIYDIETYKEILKDSWKVTPFEIVNSKDFIFEDYFNPNYSFVNLKGVSVSGSNFSRLYFFLNLEIYDYGKIKNELNKLKQKEKINQAKINKIISKSCSSTILFYLNENENFHNKIVGSNHKYTSSMLNEIYTSDVFKNYKPGLLKNHIQEVSNILGTRKTNWKKEEYQTKELNLLSKHKLYIPSYSSMKFDGLDLSPKDKILYSEYPNNLFDKYNYEIRVEKINYISEKIMNGDNFYYLRYTKLNTHGFIQIVNSLTGKVIYKNHVKLNQKLKPKHLKAISDAIKKASK